MQLIFLNNICLFWYSAQLQESICFSFHFKMVPVTARFADCLRGLVVFLSETPMRFDYFLG